VDRTLDEGGPSGDHFALWLPSRNLVAGAEDAMSSVSSE
jgi:hypothetical protein